MYAFFRLCSSLLRVPAVPVCALLLMSSCGSVVTTTTSSTSTTAGSNSPSTENSVDYASAYKSATWAAGVTVAFPSSCSMTVTASGTPPSHSTYYLAPAGTGQTVVATTASGIQLAVMPYSMLGAGKAISATFNICPSKASTTTATSGGAIGVITSGEVLFDAYEATNTVALSDNASYTFTSGGMSYTASFIDGCNSHPTGGMGGGSTWHYHGNPVCWTPTVDGTGASHIIGIALDGFPIYGGLDINGKIVDPSTLDACNGITSATPEFPAGAYHYVLPLASAGVAVTTKQSSLGCYAGTVSATLSAQMKQLACKMPMLLASGKMRLPDGREVDKKTAAEFVAQTMPGMQMPANAWEPKGQTRSASSMVGMDMRGMGNRGM